MSSRRLNEMRALSARDVQLAAMNDEDEVPIIGQELLQQWDFWRSVLAEFVGMTFFLFVTIGTVIFGSKGGSEGSGFILTIAMAFGFSIAVLVFILAPISGGNFNPAVSVGLLVTRKISAVRCVFYVLAQMAGAVAGAGIVRAMDSDAYIDNGGGANVVADKALRGGAFVGEVVATGLLVFTVMVVTDKQKHVEHSQLPTFGPFMIGMAVMLAHMVMIPVDGCSINPARTFGTAVISGKFDDHWIFWIAPLVGGSLFALIYWLVFHEPSSKSAVPRTAPGHPSVEVLTPSAATPTANPVMDKADV